ncbi:MAG: ABC transporter substrate-binding protein, partial [Nitrospinaceae bacterium]|nr:ABC transporter substrate-binding protein [Nitrospinaceae bacterium]
MRSALIGLVVFLLAGGSLVWASEITNSVKATIDEVISIVKDESLKGQQDLRR